MDTEISIALLITSVSLFVSIVGMVIAYVKEKTSVAENSGKMQSTLNDLVKKCDDLKEIPVELIRLSGNIRNVDNRLNGLPNKVERMEMTLEKLKALCPMYNNKDCEESRK